MSGQPAVAGQPGSATDQPSEPASATQPSAEPPARIEQAEAPRAPASAEPPAAPQAVAPAPPAPVAAPPLPDAPTPPPLPARAVIQPDRPIAPPDPALQEAGRYGPLPRVGPDGRTPVRAYSRAFDRSDTRPRIGIVMGGMGLSESFSDEAIRRLPGAVGLAFSPYASRNDGLLDRARARGMELLSALPLEPAGYPINDPGEWALLTGISPEQNIDRLDWTLSRLQGQVGAVGALGAMRGERFAAVPDLIGLVQDHLRSRGLLYIDPRPGAGNPERAWGRGVDVVIDEPATRGEIDRRLAELERIARDKGSALGIAADPAPVTVERLTSWASTLAERGLVLAPVSVMIRRPEGQPR
ncbi:divergent polysaccharide deacetylase family protein [Acetobacteraceae bacterium H6797]|nr:divergent polysaccharide deacetylase family protein [Acetobacteraceae bacterium H6797]